MTGILLNDTSYEQDIRELLMAFYPGETFVHEEQGNMDRFVEESWTCRQQRLGRMHSRIRVQSFNWNSGRMASVLAAVCWTWSGRTGRRRKARSSGNFIRSFRHIQEKNFHGGL